MRINSTTVMVPTFLIGSLVSGLAGLMVTISYNSGYYSYGDTAVAVGLAVSHL